MFGVRLFCLSPRRGWAYTRGGMKSTTLFAAAAAGLFLGSVSCERHSWDEVKKLHESHGSHGHGGGHGDAEHKDDHGGAESHGEHKDEHAKPAAH
jgi:hypothetical protein